MASPVETAIEPGRSARAGLTMALLLTMAATVRAFPVAVAAPAANPGASPPALESRAWRLAGNDEVTLRFEAGRASGSDGCNRFAASTSLEGSALRFGAPMAATQMACPEPVMRQAEHILTALASTRSFRLQTGSLWLLAADGRVLAAFRPEARSLAGSRWQVNGFNNGRQAVVSPLVGSSLDLAFSPADRVSGSAGCNRFTATTQENGSSLLITAPVVTRRFCPEPAGLMEQERRFLEALTTVTTARIEGRRLELRRADGALAITLVAATAPP
jgi:heat shock protein HslJ